eukprot:TRINITY_DN1933_c0_g1_i5.p1 TRINITY_DN1933_c0_g1~~TRINITY_DN1933_c0_g1_i5.p1  ORF type:complete len:312 (+),score=-27.43 TRINITY_DN1933_c0_g1_i5:1271-2206(+)
MLHLMDPPHPAGLPPAELAPSSLPCPENHAQRPSQPEPETNPARDKSAPNSFRHDEETESHQPKRQRLSSPDADSSEGFLNERVLYLVFQHTNWNPLLLGRTACVCKKLSAIAKRLLWKEFCLSRAPRMVNDLIAGGSNDTMYGGWDTLAKLMCYCGGCQPTANFRIACVVPGHFVRTSRFSKTSGRSFLPPACRSDVLYVTDPCEHELGPDEDEVGIFRGVIRGFVNSRTMRCLIVRGAVLENDKLCPYCRAKVWSMTTSRMIPRSASRRLAAYDGNLEYFVCVNGHLHGKCLLVPLSDSDDFSDEEPIP